MVAFFICIFQYLKNKYRFSMNKNKRIKLHEETINQITLQDLLDYASKAQSAMMQLTDNCMKFSNTNLQKLSAEVMQKVADLADTIRHAIMSNQGVEMQGDEKLSPEPQKDPTNMIEGEIVEAISIIKKYAKYLKEEFEPIEKEETTEETPKEEKEETPVEETKSVETKSSIDLSSSFQSVIDGLSDEQLSSFKSNVVSALKASGITDTAFQELVNNVESADTVDDFNFALDGIYDYADTNNIKITTETEEENEQA